MAKGSANSLRVSRPTGPRPGPVRATLPKQTVNKTVGSPKANRPVTRTAVNTYKKISTPPKSPSVAALRQKAVKSAWGQEQSLVKAGGGTRDWTNRQREQIVKTGKLRNFQGHHVRSVNGHTKKWAGDPRNIKFVTRREHLREHRGNFRNETTGKLIDRQKLLRLQKNQAISRQIKK